MAYPRENEHQKLKSSKMWKATQEEGNKPKNSEIKNGIELEPWAWLPQTLRRLKHFLPWLLCHLSSLGLLLTVLHPLLSLHLMLSLWPILADSALSGRREDGWGQKLRIFPLPLRHNIRGMTLKAILYPALLSWAPSLSVQLPAGCRYFDFPLTRKSNMSKTEPVFPPKCVVSCNLYLSERWPLVMW